MRLGICCDAMSAALAERAGAEFFEPMVTTALEPQQDRAPEGLEDLTRLSIKPEAFNVFLPNTLKATGPDVDAAKLETYTARALDRAARVGGRLIVFGSGPARMVPEGFDGERAWGQLRDFLTMAAGQAQERGIVIAIEAMSADESNIVNRLAEAVRLADEVDRPNVKVVVDNYHMERAHEGPEAIGGAGGRIAHVHVSEPPLRTPPRHGGYDWKAFFAALKRTGYNERVSIECTWDDFRAQAMDAVRTLREAWETA